MLPDSSLTRRLAAVLWLGLAGTAAAAALPDLTPAATADEVTALPGWDKELPSRMFSGFVDAGTAVEDGVDYHMHEHYFFVEAEVEDPTTAPLVVWTNGGPGASSFFGLFVELGPFFVDAASMKTAGYNKTKVPSLFLNPYSWSKLANVLIINSPPPVGYSYCDPAGPSGKGNSCGSWNDTKTALHNAIWLENWLARFPQYAESDWFLVGESYAGVYVPTLVRHMLNDPASNISSQIRGMAIGDGCVGTEVLCGAKGPGPYYHLQFFHGHGQFSDKLYSQVMSTCPRDQLLGYGVSVTDPDCKKLLAQVEAQIGPYYAYNLYDTCWYQNSLNPPHAATGLGHGFGLSNVQQRKRFTRAPIAQPPQSEHRRGLGAVNDYPCGGPGALFAWIQSPQVKAALHVPADAYFFSGDNGAGFTYNITEPNLMPFYQELAANTSIRVLVYNGDTDPSINSFVSQNWTSSLGFKELEAWRPWTLDSKQYLGGYVTRYAGDFDFLTIRGSGHMVPQYKPAVTFEFLTKWINNEPWQRWKPDL